MITPEKVHLGASNKIIITYIFIGVTRKWDKTEVLVVHRRAAERRRQQ
jgi:hypothetical protein